MTEWKIMTNKTPKLLDRNNNKDERIFAFVWYQFAVFVHKIFCFLFGWFSPTYSLSWPHRHGWLSAAAAAFNLEFNFIWYYMYWQKKTRVSVAGFFSLLNFLFYFSSRWKIIKLREIYFTSQVNKNRILSSIHSVCLTLMPVSAYAARCAVEYMMMAKRWKWKAWNHPICCDWPE